MRIQPEALEPLSERALVKLGRLGPLDGGRFALLAAAAARRGRALDVACSAMGLLPALSRHVGPRGNVIGADINETMLAEARALVGERALANVEVVRDDAFASLLPAHSFDLVHARVVIAPLGRDAELAAQLERLAKPDGWILLEEPDGFTSYRVWPDGPTAPRTHACSG